MEEVETLKIKCKTLMLLSIVNFLGNALFFVAIFILIFEQNFYKNHPKLLVSHLSAGEIREIHIYTHSNYLLAMFHFPKT